MTTDESPYGSANVTDQGTRSAVWPWVIRAVLALAALAAPIITFKAFTDSDTPDPERQQRLREARDASRGSGAGSRTGSQTTTDTFHESRP
jgi:hypothetical protein